MSVFTKARRRFRDTRKTSVVGKQGYSISLQAPVNRLTHCVGRTFGETDKFNIGAYRPISIDLNSIQGKEVMREDMGNNPTKRMGCSSSRSHTKAGTVALKNNSNASSCASSPIPTIVIEPCVEFEFEQLDKDQFRIPLTDMEIFALTTTWRAVKNNLTLNGMDMFSRMFQTRKDVKEIFDRFTDYSSTEELWESKLLERHGAAVMNVLDDIIINLDDEKYVIQLITEQGAQHAKFYGFRPQLFWAVEPAFMAVAEDSLGSTMTPTLRDIYKKAIHYILDTLVTSFEHCVGQMYCSYFAPKRNARSSSI